LQIREVPKPEPITGEVLVKVHATTVTRTSDAYRYVETGMKVGIVVINLPSTD
jgi:NADPH:quinone reductase-like Zn-dependent oxidoreductase